MPPKKDEEITEEGREDLPAFTEDEEEIIPKEGEITVPAKGEEEEVEEAPKYQFKTDEELDEFIKSRQPVAPIAPEPSVVPQKAEAEEEDEFKDLELFKGYKDPKTGEWVGEVPADWNDFARKILKHASPKTLTPKILEQVREMTQKERAELEQIDKGFDAEYDALATQGLVPQRNTPEGQEINKQITNVGASWGQSSITKAHELWKKIPKEQGGGLEYVSPTKSKVNASKAVAAKMGSSQGSSTGKPKAGSIPYNRLHTARGVDELLESEDL